MSKLIDLGDVAVKTRAYVAGIETDFYLHCLDDFTSGFYIP